MPRRLRQGVAGAALLGLEHPGEVVAGDLLAHPLGAVADDDEEARAAGGARRVHHPGEERPAGDAMEHLGERRAHALPLAGGEDDGNAGGHVCSRTARASFAGSWRIRSPAASRSASITWTPIPSIAARSVETHSELASA